MGRVLRREFFDVSPGDVFRIWPLSCLHIGASDCDERRIEKIVEEIARDERAYWIGLGDYLEGINRNDKRFDPLMLADWITTRDLADLAGAQVRRFCELIEPIAAKCLSLNEGNHEDKQRRIYERDVMGEIARAIKRMGGMDADYPLRLGYAGWLLLSFFKSQSRKGGSRMIRVYCHHGFGGGKRTGTTVNRMEDWLFSHEADILFFGHTHKWTTAKIAIEAASDKANRTFKKFRYGVAASTFKGELTPETNYAERAGYNPTAEGSQYVTLRPHVSDGWRMIEITGW